MIELLAAATLLLSPQPAQEASPAGGWTWTLYADEAPVVLAHEVPDTAHLRATLECEPGGNVAQLTLYGDGPDSGMARISAGEATAVAEAGPARGGGLRLALRTDHPAFAAFSADGRLDIALAGQRRTLEIPGAHLAKLRRFAELCSG